MVQTHQTDSMLLIPFNTFNSSHASFSLFLLPTHNSTYHLTSTTKDLGTNLGFKTSSFALVEELEEHLTNSPNQYTLQALIIKMDLEFIDHLTLISLAALALGGRRKFGEKRKRRGRHGGEKEDQK